MMTSGDTIAAISSAVGSAARIIVRTSGPRAGEILAALSPGSILDAGHVARRQITLGDLSFPAWVYTFVSPHSYTGEDLVELHVPGNPLLARMMLEAMVHHGARLAEAGEFTARAYFHGRLDLTEAEGVAASIHAQNEQELRAARQLLAGELSRRVRPPMELLAETLALVEVGIDFVEEDVTFLSADEVRSRIGRVRAQLWELEQDSARFERLSHFPQIVLVGRPNAGKSTLLNALAGHERAIVSPIAGTTRDALSADVTLRRGLVRVTDVAGLEESFESAAPPAASPAGDIARQMRQRALQHLEQADLVVLVRDLTDPRDPISLPREPDLIVLNKRDLVSAPANDDVRSIPISAQHETGLDELRRRLDELIFGQTASGAAVALNARHVQAIADAFAALDAANARVADSGAEVVAMELREALDALGQILGSVSPDDLLGRIFSAFCIGK